MSILNFTPPGFELRPYQKDILLQIEKIWDSYEVIGIDSPVGSGKSVIAQTIARWRESKQEATATVVHRVLLQDQYNESFPDIPVIKGSSRYICGENTNDEMTCEDHYDLYGEYCANCPLKRLSKTAKNSKNAVFNFHSYVQYKAHKKNLIIDECHSIYSVMSDMFTMTLWKHKHNYPNSFNTLGDVAIWLESLIKKETNKIATFRQLHSHLFDHDNIKKLSKEEKALLKEHRSTLRNVKKYKLIYEGLQKAPTNFFIEHSKLPYKGKELPALSIKPTTLEGLPPILWPRSATKKIILMSGTINKLDLDYIGLKSRKTKIIEISNPIPSDNRPIIIRNPINMSYEYQSKNISKIIEQINGILDEHKDSKGIIHTTYSLADKIRVLVNNPRIMTHNKDNKDRIFNRFKNKKDNSVLLACGMSEGIDLNGEDYQFQIIMKIMWPSLKDKFIKSLYETNMDRILWETVKTIRQQTGRICRGPTDKGTTYIIDASFGNPTKGRFGLFQKAKKFWGKDFIDSIIWE